MEKIKKISLFWNSKQQRKHILMEKLVRVRKQREFRAAIKFRSRKNKIFNFKNRGNNGLGVAFIRRILEIESEIFDLIIGEVVFFQVQFWLYTECVSEVRL